MLKDMNSAMKTDYALKASNVVRTIGVFPLFTNCQNANSILIVLRVSIAMNSISALMVSHQWLDQLLYQMANVRRAQIVDRVSIVMKCTSALTESHQCSKMMFLDAKTTLIALLIIIAMSSIFAFQDLHVHTASMEISRNVQTTQIVMQTSTVTSSTSVSQGPLVLTSTLMTLKLAHQTLTVTTLPIVTSSTVASQDLQAHTTRDSEVDTVTWPDARITQNVNQITTVTNSTFAFLALPDNTILITMKDARCTMTASRTSTAMSSTSVFKVLLLLLMFPMVNAHLIQIVLRMSTAESSNVAFLVLHHQPLSFSERITLKVIELHINYTSLFHS